MTCRGSLAARLFILLWATALGACGTLPYDGPSVRDVRDEARTGEVKPFALVSLSRPTLDTLAHRADTSLASQFGDDSPRPEILVQVGDSVAVNIWETGTDTLFSSAPSQGGTQVGQSGAHLATIPTQIVGEDGMISVPFVGRIAAAGKTVLAIQASVEKALSGKASRPQVLVTVAHGASSAVTVVGEASTGTSVSLTAHSERVLDVLAASGSTHLPAYQTLVQLTRNGKSESVLLSHIISEPRENVVMRPGDTLSISRFIPSFTAFGASGHNAQVPFTSEHVSLVEAVAQAGGLLDSRADPSGVYVFRYESKELAESLGSDPSIPAFDGQIPVVYQVDLTRVGGYFLAQNFAMQDHDIVFVSSAPSKQLTKLLILLGLITQPATSGVLLDNALR